MMTVKEYLTKAYRLDQRINSKIEQVASLNDLATKATNTISDMPKNSSHSTSTMADIIVKIVDLQAEINNDIDCLIELKRDIVKAIKVLDNIEHQTLLELRYLCFKTWEQIAVDMGYNLRHVYRIHDAAVSSLKISKRSQ